MKRLRVILGFLLAGAVINVAVAWGIALTVTIKNTSINNVTTSMFHDAGELWELTRFEAFGTHFYLSDRVKVPIEEERSFFDEHVKPNWGSMDDITNFYQTLPGRPEFARETRMFEARGWPMSSLWCRRYLNVYHGTGFKRFGSRGLISTPILPDEYWGPRVLPLYPIWTGFIVNTIFYVSLLWLLINVPLALLHMIRHKHGLCVKCAYDLRGADHKACPECGAALVRTNIA